LAALRFNDGRREVTIETMRVRKVPRRLAQHLLISGRRASRRVWLSIQCARRRGFIGDSADRGHDAAPRELSSGSVVYRSLPL